MKVIYSKSFTTDVHNLSINLLLILFKWQIFYFISFNIFFLNQNRSRFIFYFFYVTDFYFVRLHRADRRHQKISIVLAWQYCLLSPMNILFIFPLTFQSSIFNTKGKLSRFTIIITKHYSVRILLYFNENNKQL